MSTDDEITAKDLVAFLREHLQELNVKAEWLARAGRLGPDAAREMLSELYEVLEKKWPTGLADADTTFRLRFSRGVLSNLAKRRVEASAKDARIESLPEDGDSVNLPDCLREGDVAEQLISSELVAELHRCLASLSPVERQVVTLKYLDENAPRTHRAIGQELGLPEHTISRIYRSALDKIRPRLLAMSFDASDHGGGSR